MIETSLQLALVFGGRSSEHAVSLASARAVMRALQPLGHRLWPLAIDRTGDWFLLSKSPYFIEENELSLNRAVLTERVAICPAASGAKLINLANGKVICERLQLLMPLLHGVDGEDGAIQGLAQMCDLPCCGAAVAGSALAIDKELSKRILRSHRLPVLPFISFHAREEPPDWQFCRDSLAAEQLFVKPANQGSSFGVSKVSGADQWLPALELARRYGDKILIEQAVTAREIEFAILEEKGNIRVSCPGEISCKNDFYDYADKYLDNDNSQLIIDCDLDEDLKGRLKQSAAVAFRALGLSGFARVDFFVVDNQQFYINELNSIPGFTARSMFPLLWQHQGFDCSAVLNQIIGSAVAGGRCH